MARGITALLLAEIVASKMSPIVFFEGEFSSGWIRVWSGPGTLTWDGKDWSGVGDFMSVSPMSETGTVSATGITVGLSGIPSDLISVVYNEARQGKIGKVYIGAFDSTGAIVADPYMAFAGKLDVPTDSDDGESAKITITYETRLIDLERPRERRFTPESQKIDYPDDEGFAFVAPLQDAQLTWGRA
jgi:hypothetical protein